MKQIALCAFAAFLLFAWTQDGFAEIYSYRDENGNLVFSDAPPDAAEVPPSQVQVTREVAPSPSPRTSSGKAENGRKGVNAPPGQSVAPKKKKPSNAEIQAYIEGRNRLNEEARELREERDALQEEANALAEEGKRIRKRSAMRVHNTKVQEVNDKIMALSEKARDHDRRVRAYEEEHQDIIDALTAGNN
ncbi:DUF4124 domain-containing protein [Desulfatibacillum aliphaticivorans]|uniref:DUF4124 domain-containing protein n=1 Tax=Desulfatibacillum aliphaticivorans TaxID=218208 RepID=B8FG68_DESAL|nr:DUF4124 domain-containing protein [Desulfatibacillum aliphaticivorans]ACL03748.1 hypothetical protein Dalk_2053 [Desulfatibacillum aliphaticivorans]